MSIFELDIKAREYFEIMAKIAELETAKKALQEIFQEAMCNIEQEEISGHGWKCTWKNATRKSLDSTAIEKDFPDIAEKYSKETNYTRFTLNQIKSAV